MHHTHLRGKKLRLRGDLGPPFSYLDAQPLEVPSSLRLLPLPGSLPRHQTALGSTGPLANLSTVIEEGTFSILESEKVVCGPRRDNVGDNT